MSVYVDQDGKNFLVVTSLDGVGTQALLAATRALTSSRWDSHKEIAKNAAKQLEETESGAVEMVINRSAAVRIEDDIHYKSIKGNVALGAKKLQVLLATFLDLDPSRPLRQKKN